ncbi:MAG: hypothetical protein GuCV1_gp2 [Guiyang chuvirus 1]|nr:MAG: hypothetical protein GuCV1_gp2 [Guiyang chuvirus 1]
MLGHRNKVGASNRKILMKIGSGVGASPLTSVGQGVFSQDAAPLHLALHAMGYTLQNRAVAGDGVMSYDALLAFMHELWAVGRHNDGVVDNAFVQAVSEMTAVWRYEDNINEQQFDRRRQWLLRATSTPPHSVAKVRTTFSRALRLLLDAIGQPQVPVDATVNLWTNNRYAELGEIPAALYFLWVSKLAAINLNLFSENLEADIRLTVATGVVAGRLQASATAALDNIVNWQLDGWYTNRTPLERVRYWELRSFCVQEEGHIKQLRAIFLSLSAICKTGTVSAGWVDSRRRRWGLEVQEALDDASQCGREAIMHYYTTNVLTEDCRDKLYDFLASAYFSAQILVNQPVLWMIEQARCHNIASATMFAELINRLPAISMTSLMLRIPTAQWVALMRLMCVTMQDAFINIIRPFVTSAEYPQIADLATSYNRARYANNNRRGGDQGVARQVVNQALDNQIFDEMQAWARHEARAMLTPPPNVLHLAGINNYVVQDDTVYVDPREEGVNAAAGALFVGNYGEDVRRQWPPAARNFSNRAAVVPLGEFQARVRVHESPEALAYRRVVESFHAFCGQKTLEPAMYNQEAQQYIIPNRVLEIPANVRADILAWNPQFPIPQVPPIIANHQAISVDDGPSFKVLFHPITNAEIRPVERANIQQIARQDDEVIEGGIEAAAGDLASVNLRESTSSAASASAPSQNVVVPSPPPYEFGLNDPDEDTVRRLLESWGLDHRQVEDRNMKIHIKPGATNVRLDLISDVISALIIIDPSTISQIVKIPFGNICHMLITAINLLPFTNSTIGNSLSKKEWYKIIPDSPQIRAIASGMGEVSCWAKSFISVSYLICKEFYKSDPFGEDFIDTLSYIRLMIQELKNLLKKDLTVIGGLHLLILISQILDNKALFEHAIPKFTDPDSELSFPEKPSREDINGFIARSEITDHQRAYQRMIAYYNVVAQVTNTDEHEMRSKVLCEEYNRLTAEE